MASTDPVDDRKNRRERHKVHRRRRGHTHCKTSPPPADPVQSCNVVWKYKVTEQYGMSLK